MTPGSPAADVAAPDRSRTTAAASPGIVAWYAEGVSDAVGDRLLLFDNAGPGLELLRLHPALATAPGFEDALRARVDEIADFRHSAFARVRSVTMLDDPRPQLAVVSEIVAGERLSRVLEAARLAGARPDPGAVVWLLRQLLPALGDLHDRAGGAPHGLLTPDRIIVTPDGRLVISEHVLGPAVNRLGLDRGALWRDLGIAAPQRGSRAVLNARSDVLQVALLAVALLRGRPLGPKDYPQALLQVLDDACDRASWSLVPVVRGWLSRALTLEAPPFDSAHEAHAALDRLLPGLAGAWSPALLPKHAGAEAASRGTGGPRQSLDADASSRWSRLLDPEPHGSRAASAGDTRDTLHIVKPQPRGEVIAIDRPHGPARTATASSQERSAASVLGLSRGGLLGSADVSGPLLGEVPADDQTTRRLWLLSAGLSVIAIAEAVALVVLLVRGSAPAAPPPAAAGVAASAPAEAAVMREPAVSQASASPSPAGTSGAARVAPGTDAPAPIQSAGAQPTRPAVPAFGWLSIDSPVPLRVYANGRLLGPSARGRMRLPAGRHDVRLVNDDLQFTYRQEVAITGGSVTTVRPRLPRRR